MKLLFSALAVCFCAGGMVVVANIPFISRGILFMIGDSQVKKANYHYSSARPDGFSVWSRKGDEDVFCQFETYRSDHPDDAILYRNFEVKPLHFWRWREYLTKERYQLAYKPLPADAKTRVSGAKCRR